MMLAFVLEEENTLYRLLSNIKKFHFSKMFGITCIINKNIFGEVFALNSMITKKNKTPKESTK